MINIVEITDINAPELDIYGRLSEAQLLHYNEPKEGVFIAESPLVIERALAAGYKPLSLLIEKDKLNQELAKTNNLVEMITSNQEDQSQEDQRYIGVDPIIYTASEEVLAKITGFKLTRGALCVMQRVQLKTPEEICKNAKRIAVLEDVVNPTNVGAIMRSAAALNIDAVLLTSPCSDPFYRRAARVSMGTVFQVPWTYIYEETEQQKTKQQKTEQQINSYPTKQDKKTNSYSSYIEQIKNLGFKTAAMALTDNSVGIDDEKLMSEDHLAIILGTEGAGLRKETIEACDYTVKIPMSHGVDSLNVAAASAVAFWQLGNR